MPSTYISSKGLPIQLYFTISELQTSEFTTIICKDVPVGFVYTVFIKVRYNVDAFYMAGNQFGFIYSCESDIKGLFSVISNKLEEYMGYYNLGSDTIVYIQITFRQKDKKLLSEFSLEKPSNFPKYETSLVDSELFLPIPVSINEDYLW